MHSRLDGFRPGDLAALITDRSVVRIALMRGTIHLVSARDCLPLRRLVQPVIERGMRGAFGKQLAGVDTRALAAAGRSLVEAEPMTFSQLGQALATRWPDHPPAALAQGISIERQGAGRRQCRYGVQDFARRIPRIGAVAQEGPIDDGTGPFI